MGSGPDSVGIHINWKLTIPMIFFSQCQKSPDSVGIHINWKLGLLGDYEDLAFLSRLCRDPYKLETLINLL